MRNTIIENDIKLKESIKVIPLNKLQEKLELAYKIASKAYEEANDEWEKPQNDAEANDTLLRMGGAIAMMTIAEELSKWAEKNVVKGSDDEADEQPIKISGEDFLNIVLNALKENRE